MGKIYTLQRAVKYFEECPSKWVMPKSITGQIDKLHTKISLQIKKAFLCNKRHYKIIKLALLKYPCQQLWQEKLGFLSFFDTIQFCCYLGIVEDKTDQNHSVKI